jgi:hypothetical protein
MTHSFKRGGMSQWALSFAGMRLPMDTVSLVNSRDPSACEHGRLPMNSLDPSREHVGMWDKRCAPRAPRRATPHHGGCIMLICACGSQGILLCLFKAYHGG